MAIIVSTEDPRQLLVEIKSMIDRGGIATWKYDVDGDFTHSPDQWAYKAWFRPSVQSDGLIFSVLTPKNTTMSKMVYGVYHGRFIEMLLTHFDLKFSRVTSSALPSYDDLIKA